MIMPDIRKYVELLYTDTVNIYEYVNVTDPVTHITSSVKQLVTENEPCRMSYLSNREIQGDYYDSSEVKIRLFVRPDLVVKNGSYLEVTRDGVMQKFICSGYPRRYKSHLEIEMRYEDEN